MRILSLGAGVQSTTLLLMACEGVLQIDCAIFADTQWEPKAVYEHLDWLEEYATSHGQVVHRVTRGNLREEALNPDHKFASMPLHIKNLDGKTSVLRRQCTNEYKLNPIRRKVRELGATRKNPATLLIGISMDEFQRMKDSLVQYIKNEFPLIDLQMSRKDCLAWMARRNFPTPPKSSCIGCPFHNNPQWQEIWKVPAEWDDAVAFDEAIRHRRGRTDFPAYLHFRGVPLKDIDLRTPQERGQLDLFNEECTGMCGV
jgi:3'-phosphoadenosine 5'-phosphosulfate sulfotransferase (PAPS reductase)/FAD synthetase